MHRKHWKDLVIGVSIIGLSMCLWFNDQYTLDIAMLIGILTLLWLLNN
jgi:hypothetical protein